MRNRASAALLAAYVAFLTGCKSHEEAPRPPAAERPQVLNAIPIIERSLLTDTTGAEDAERRTYLVQAPFDSVTRFYRRMLPALGWRVVGDLGDSVHLDLHAVKGGPTLWMRIRKAGSLATEYTIIGSVTSAAPIPQPQDTTR